jgi:hypothetical protein
MKLKTKYLHLHTTNKLVMNDNMGTTKENVKLIFLSIMSALLLKVKQLHSTSA